MSRVNGRAPSFYCYYYPHDDFFVCMLTSTFIQRIALRLARARVLLIQKETRSVSNEFDRTIRNKFLRKKRTFLICPFYFQIFQF